MKIIDSHMHLDLWGYSATSILENMDRKGIDQTWLLSWEELVPPVPELHTDLPPDPILEAASRYPQRFIPCYAPDPSRDGLGNHFNMYMKAGIRLCGELKVSLTWSDPMIERYLELVQEHQMAMVFHMETPCPYYRQERPGYLQWLFERVMNDKYNGISRHYISRFAESTGILKKKIDRNRVQFPGILFDFEALERRVQQFPGIRFIGHGPHFWNNISTRIDPRYIHQKGSIGGFGIIDRLLESYDNFYCDLSGESGFNALKRDRKNSRIFLQKHAEKLLYGTDNTKLPLLELLHSMKPGNEATSRILSDNALKVLNL